ncbi:MAG: Na+/H+ antiporter NhaC family protein, partial [Mailhella sp.]|nr:Na+/H+ antiporter NhaC family protein [Mailhella sp.]
AGWLSLLPPITAIALALITKEVFSSLMIGILSGTLIYSFGTGADFAIMNTVQSAFAIMAKRADFNIIMFCSALGALVYVISLAGGSRAYGKWATSRIKSRRSAMFSTCGLGALIFIDDYFNCLTVGTVMKPVTDTYKISRAKLAYIIDATAAPICIIAPISSWAAAVGSNLKATGAFESEMAAFIAAIPYNFYSLLSLLLVFLLCFFKWDFGPMRAAEKRAAEGDLGMLAQQSDGKLDIKNGTVMDMLIPIGALILFAVLSMLYSGGYWGADAQYHSFGAAFGNCEASQALVWSSFGALVVALLLYVPRRLMNLAEYMHGMVEGMKAMLPANLVLVLAWGLSGVCQDMLQTPKFVESLVTGGSMVGPMLPFLIFVIAGFLSFSTGTAWGSFGILIPLVVPIAQALCPELLVVALSATLAGSVFGDHCSPISDTTILSSAGAGCSHIDHVSTQLPYALLAAACSASGYLVAGFVSSSPWLCLLAGGGLMAAFLLAVNAWSARREAAAR